MIKNFINKYENEIIIFIGIYLMINELILRFFNMGSSVLLTIIYPFILVFLLFKIDFKSIKRLNLFITLFYILFVISNVLYHGFFKNTLKSLIFVNRSFALYLFVFYIVNQNIKLTEKIIYKYLYWILNSYFFINLPIVLIEIIKPIYIPSEFVLSNPITADHMTGLIGINGTHILTFYWLALIFINILVYNNKKNKKLLIVTIFEIALMFFISAFSDNTAFYIFFPIFIFEFIFIDLIKIEWKKLVKITIITLAIISIIFSVAIQNQRFRSFFTSRVVLKLNQYINPFNNKSGDERLELFRYALDNGNGRTFGKGIGSIELYGDERLPDHFGMNEISIRTYEGGVIYLILLLIITTLIIKDIICLKCNDKKSILVYTIIIFNLSLLAIYTEIFSDQYKIIFLLIMCIAFKFKYFNDK